MELLLDLQMTRMRRSSRPEILRRYLRAVQSQFASGAPVPLRFSRFIESEMHLRRSGLARRSTAGKLTSDLQASSSEKAAVLRKICSGMVLWRKT